MASFTNMESMDPLRDRFNHFFQQDAERAQLIQDILEKLHQDKARLDELTIELEHERESRIRYLSELRDLREQSRQWDHKINKDPYVAVLVDGDGAIFDDELLQNPRQGAPEAALRLTHAVRNYLKNTPFGSEDVPIVVRIFANLNGLAKSLVQYNVIDFEDKMRMFAELFTNSRAEFDFVNVGHGKENADSKMRRMFSHFYKNFQCKKIFFAGCHDNGYLHELREYAGESARQRIVLLETTPAQPTFIHMGFPVTRFDTVFRTEVLGSPPIPPASLAVQRTQPPTVSMNNPGVVPQQQIAASPVMSNGAPVVRSASTPTARIDSPAPVPPAAPIRQDSPAIIASGNGGVSIQYPTYATAGNAKGHQNVVIAAASKTKEPRVIHYNSGGQRIDPPNNKPQNAHDQRTYNEKNLKIKPKGFCNELFLADGCQRGPNCPLEHEIKLTPGERAVHRWKARGSLCSNGPYCESYRCYLSHHCPFGPGCARGSECKFKGTRWGDLHYSKADLEPDTRWVEGHDFPTRIGSA
ncbi:uncharacterized protein ACLA_052850 [Aspergillus clavatus NRRL 1]|uniref:C3H1-type domain-containing protein n=1 Tax=Aspergillus clavatus (strain ATCC 1007 / CBS 513.65 / DSM 816 / NCTC 3887 / NRRL 1 / QM 1276 / 107) TaxID=344612 RepID=A1CIV7_ASPCL|nr:uncharacterized protein ACLA_052850 [Aspergillus clavatus NRRL 1]EAW10812.1 conserved hypothetical protein [Aspergillus clavatus NRRL 1]